MRTVHEKFEIYSKSSEGMERSIKRTEVATKRLPEDFLGSSEAQVLLLNEAQLLGRKFQHERNAKGKPRRCPENWLTLCPIYRTRKVVPSSPSHGLGMSPRSVLDMVSSLQ